MLSSIALQQHNITLDQGWMHFSESEVTTSHTHFIRNMITGYRECQKSVYNSHLFHIHIHFHNQHVTINIHGCISSLL